MINNIVNKVGEGLGKLMNLVPDPSRITIIPLKEHNTTTKVSGDKFVAMFNPEQWIQKWTFNYSDQQTPGSAAPTPKFFAMGDADLDLELLFDGTGATGEKVDVAKRMVELWQTISFNGDIHQPNKLQIIWGQFSFEGIAKELSITYTLFKPDGTPLRAKVQLKVSKGTNNEGEAQQGERQSSDLTHVRTLQESQRLDQLCDVIYDSPRFVAAVAQANSLTTFRYIKTGTVLQFPPLQK